jgi:molybdopterin-containing oxidoreductase family iron-sulfur binding subunit
MHRLPPLGEDDVGEFPEGADLPPDVTRRDVLRLLGASAALAGSAGCSRGAAERIVPYVDQPPEVTPGVPALYATTMAIDGYGVGLLAECHEGRPTKVEGNPAHPASAGALGTFAQASILSLYDPARARALSEDGKPATWSQFVTAITPTRGRRPTRLVLEPTSSPHVIDLVDRARSRGDVVVHYHAALSREAAWRGAALAFGGVLEPRWEFARAEVVVALDSDFLAAAATPPSWARAWARGRALEGPGGRLARLYVVEPRLTVTGMSADERLAVQAREVRGVAAALLRELLAGGGPQPAASATNGMPRGPHDAWAKGVARDLRAHAGASLVVVGDGQPAAVHAFAHAMNELLGNAGRTVTYGPSPVHDAGGRSHDPRGLVQAIDAGEVGALVMVGTDPAYTAPADLGLAARIARVPVTAHVGLYENATARLSRWRVPEAHFLETWSDARAADGTPSIAQPVIRPRSEGFTAGQVLAALAGGSSDPRELVRSAWRELLPATDFEERWTTTLASGLLVGGASPAVKAAVDWGAIAAALREAQAPHAPLELVVFGDAKVHDGRFGDNAWLQELADPVTKLTWDNAALVSAATAARLGVASEDVVELKVRDRRVRAPVLVVPGVADDVVALALGYGQDSGDLLSSGVGANAYALRDSRAPWFDDAEVHRTPERWPLALTQEHGSMQGRPLALRRTLGEYRADPSFAARLDEEPRQLYGLRPTGTHQWGMTIDLNACTGCSACVVACMAENNVPVVGKGGVRLGRAMHWLRIDRYFVDGRDGPEAALQPMLCQHCEHAPCEYVCPVNATVHSADGLNEMVYNRCVGTRFCSNNCPYKVRRFNFFNYNADKPDGLRLAMNPDVTVRARGVMEKCTYCVQRIRETEIRARREQRPIRDLEVVTACQQTCPTGAIVFGDIADASTRVSATRRNPRLYAVLGDLGTRPRTRYLARVTNPLPEGRPA